MSGAQFATLVLAAILVFWMIGAYNRLVALRTAIGAAWAQFEEPLQRQRSAIDTVLQAVRPALPDDAPALDALQGAALQVQAAAEAVRARPIAAHRTAAFVTAEQVLASALARVLALLEHHPALRDETAAVTEGLHALRDLEPRLAFARQLFNDAAQAYNDAARQWPTRLLTHLFGFGTAGRL